MAADTPIVSAKFHVNGSILSHNSGYHKIKIKIKNRKYNFKKISAIVNLLQCYRVGQRQTNHMNEASQICHICVFANSHKMVTTVLLNVKKLCSER